MATYKHLRSSTANKRPTTSIADGQLALNTNATSPGLFFKDSTGATIIKIGPVHVGTTAPNATPGAGGSSGNSTGEVWLDTSITPVGVKIWNGSAWVNGTPTGSTTVQGLLELATDVETQSGSDAARAVTPAGLQSKVSDSISTTSSTTIASSTAVKAAYDLAAAGLPRSGGTVTGNLEIGTTGSLTFEGSVADGFETALAATNPTADRVITLPDISGTVVTTGDTGSVTSAMIANGTIVSGDIASGTILDSNISASAEIAVSKLADGAAGQIIQTDSAGTGVEWSDTANLPLGSAAAPAYRFQGDANTGIYSPGADQVAISTNGTGRLFVTSDGKIGVAGTPSNPLDVFGSATLGIRYKSSGSYAGIVADNTSSTGGGYFGCHQNGTQKAVFGLTGAFLGDTSADAGVFAETGQAIRFFTNGSTSEKARITDDGKLGLGTSSVGALLHANQTTAGDNVLRLTGNYSSSGTSPLIVFERAGGAVAGHLRYNDAFNAMQIGTTSAHRFDLYTNSNTALTIDSSQRVGIGTTAPSNTLHVVGTAQINTGDGADGLLIRRQFNNPIDLRLRTFDDSSKDYVIRNDNGSLRFIRNATEQAQLDSSGRLLVGTSSARTNFYSGTGGSVNQTETIFTGGTFNAVASYLMNTTGGGGPEVIFAKARGSSSGSVGLALDGDSLGQINFAGADGTNFITAAFIGVKVDSTSGANDMPGRLVFSTTADGASSPTERFRITNDGVIAHDQPAPAAVNATATLTVANLKAGIITSTSAAATDMTLPTGTDTQAGFSGTYDNFTFEWSVINTGPSLVRVLAGTAHTIVGSGSVATGTSGRFASRRTAANTFVTYRLS